MKKHTLKSISFLVCGVLPASIFAGGAGTDASAGFSFFTTKTPDNKRSILISMPDFSELKNKIPAHVPSVIAATLLTVYTIARYKKVSAELKAQLAKESAAQVKYGFPSTPTKKQILKKMLSSWQYDLALLVGLGIIGAEQYSLIQNMFKKGGSPKKAPESKQDAAQTSPLNPADEEASVPFEPAEEVFPSIYPNLVEASAPSILDAPEAEQLAAVLKLSEQDT